MSPDHEVLGDGLQRNSFRNLFEDEHSATAESIVAKYPNSRSAVMPLLFLAQSIEGHVTEDGMRSVGDLLGLTPAEVLAAASFYTMLKKRPQGDYLVSVCRNISCTHRGARSVLAALQDRLGIGPGAVTPDGRFGLEAVECLATCDGAPSHQINYEDFSAVSPQEAIKLVDALERGQEVRSVRGELVRTSKEIAFETATAGSRLPGAVGDRDARTVGGESPPPDMAPGFRPKLEGGEGG